MALRAGYKGIKKYIADMLNGMSPGDGIATDKEVSDAFDEVVGWNQDDEHDSVETLLNGKVDNSVIGPVEDGEKASQAYAVGEHFIRNSKFCTVIQTIAAEATLTKDTNYVEGTVGDTIYIEKFHGTQTVTAGNFFSEAVTLPSGYDVVMSDVIIAKTGAAAYAIPKIICTANDKNSRTTAVLNTDTNDHTWDIYSHFILKKT